MSNKQVYARLYNFMKPYKNTMIISIVMIILGAIFVSFAPLVLGRATDDLLNLVTDGKVNGDVKKSFIFFVTLYAIITLIFSAFKYVSSKTMAKVAQHTIYDLRDKVDKKFKKLPLKYIDSNEYGDILSRVTNDIDTISNSLQQSLEESISAVTTVLFILVIMMIISPILTIIAIITLPLTILLSMNIMKKSQKYFDLQQKHLGEVNGYVEEIYSAHNIVSAFVREKEVLEKFKAKNNKLYDVGWKAQFFSSVMMPIAQGMTNLGYIAIVIVSGLMAISGNMSIGMIQAFVQYLKRFSQPIMQTSQIVGIAQSTVSASRRVFEFLDEKEEVLEKNNEIYFEKGYISFENVAFGYSEDKRIMENVSFEVNKGETVAIVGPTGAGKTTIVNLLLRFYDTTKGSIKIDGVDIKDVKRESLRRLFGMVLQDTWLFKGSIMENIRYGRLDATDDEVFEASKMARSDDFINGLPKGYDFELQEHATNIAQGERQLITIARAFISNAPIIILDEATSSVDTRTEKMIQEGIEKLMQGKTSFIIAHRLSTIRNADKIIYMEQGDIKEIGSHKELIKLDGYYARLYKSQFEE